MSYTTMGVDLARRGGDSTRVCICRGNRADTLSLKCGGTTDEHLQLVIANIKYCKPSLVLVDSVSVGDPMIDLLRGMAWEAELNVPIEEVKITKQLREDMLNLFNSRKFEISGFNVTLAHELAAYAKQKERNDE